MCYSVYEKKININKRNYISFTKKVKSVQYFTMLSKRKHFMSKL